MKMLLQEPVSNKRKTESLRKDMIKLAKMLMLKLAKMLIQGHNYNKNIREKRGRKNRVMNYITL